MKRLQLIGSMTGIPDARDACYKINRQIQNLEREIEQIMAGDK